MTAQASDDFYYRAHNYYLCRTSADLSFDPTQFGIIPVPHSTAHNRGYVVKYEVKNSLLLIRDIEIDVMQSDKSKTLFGVDPIYKKAMGINVYRNINLPIKYTGNIYVTSGLLMEYYKHMGFQFPWAFEKGYDFKFKNGELVHVEDCSDIIAGFRKKLESANKFGENPWKNLASVLEKDTDDLDEYKWWLRGPKPNILTRVFKPIYRRLLRGLHQWKYGLWRYRLWK